MSENFYAPPKARLQAEVDPPEAPTAGFYVVSIGKFNLLYYLTVGFYGYYWFYRHWRARARATGEQVWPWARALFQIFFVHELFRALRQELQARRASWNEEVVATIFVAALIIGFVLDRIPGRFGVMLATALLQMALFVVGAYCLQSAQAAANVVCGDSDGESNRRLTWANWSWMALGSVGWLYGGFWILLVILGVLR